MQALRMHLEAAIVATANVALFIENADAKQGRSASANISFAKQTRVRPA